MHFNKGKAYGRQGKAPTGLISQHSILLFIIVLLLFFAFVCFFFQLRASVVQACMLCREHSEVTISAVLYPWGGEGEHFCKVKRFLTRSNKLRAYFIL